MTRLWALLMALVFAGAACAQATAPVSSAVSAGEERFHSFTINFGGTPAAHVVSLSVSGNSATAGISAFLGNLDEMAAAGFATGAAQGSDVGTGTVNISVTTPAYSGVHTFIVNIAENVVTAGITYTGTISCATLGSGAITAGATVLRAPLASRPSVQILFNRIALVGGNLDGDTAFDALADFGTTPQTATFWSQIDADDDGSMQVQEILASGAAGNLGAAVSGTGNWSDEAVRTTSSRSGNVRLRMQVTLSTASMGMNGAMVLPSTVSFVALTQIAATGSLTANQGRVHRFAVDFGTGATRLSLMPNVVTSTGSVDFALIDRTELAAFGAATGVANGVPYLTGSHSGVHDILITVEENGGAAATYDVSLFVAVLPAAVTATTQTYMTTDRFFNMFDIATRGSQDSTVGTPSASEFLVDFGTTPQAVTFFVNGQGDVTGDISVYEVTTAGTGTLLGAPLGGAGTWNDQANYTTSSRSGLVRIRLVGNPGSGTMTGKFTCVFPKTASVQALTTITLAGSLTPGQTRAHRVSMNYGAASTQYAFAPIVADSTGIIDFSVADVNELAANGPATGTFVDTPGFVPVAHAGVQEFVFLFSEASNTAGATYNLILTVAVPGGSVSALGTQTVVGVSTLETVFNIAVQGRETIAAAGSVTHDFNINFGATTHTANIWISADGADTGTVELFDMSSGTPVSVGLASWTGASSDDLNVVTAAHTGVIKFRVVLTTAVANDISWTVLADRSSNISLIGGGGGGGDDGGCSTGQGSNPWLLLVGALSLLALGARLRRSPA